MATWTYSVKFLYAIALQLPGTQRENYCKAPLFRVKLVYGFLVASPALSSSRKRTFLERPPQDRKQGGLCPISTGQAPFLVAYPWLGTRHRHY